MTRDELKREYKEYLYDLSAARIKLSEDAMEKVFEGLLLLELCLPIYLKWWIEEFGEEPRIDFDVNGGKAFCSMRGPIEGYLWMHPTDLVYGTVYNRRLGVETGLETYCKMPEDVGFDFSTEEHGDVHDVIKKVCGKLTGKAKLRC